MNYALEILKAARRLLADAEYVHDPDHDNKPSGGNWHKTDKGWSTSEEEGNKKEDEPDKKDGGGNSAQKTDSPDSNDAASPKKRRVMSRGELSIKRMFGNKYSTGLEDIYGKDSGVEIMPESRFRKENKESYSMKNLYEIITGFTKKDASRLRNSGGFRTDFVIRSSRENNRALPFPVFVETDGIQHENGRTDEKSGFRFDLIDRVKDYVARTRHNGIAVRLRSEDQTGEQLKFVLSELKRYNDIITNEQPDVSERDRKGQLQEYADALSLGFAASDKRAGNEHSTTLPIDGHPREYIKNLKKSIVKRIEVNNMDKDDRKRNKIPADYETRYPKLDDTEKKMLKIMTADYDILDDIVYSPKNLKYSKHISEEDHKSNYRFMRSIDLSLKRSEFLSWKRQQRAEEREKKRLKKQQQGESGDS